jgi:hypothetical protein
MAIKTRLSIFGVPGRAYGSFLPREEILITLVAARRVFTMDTVRHVLTMDTVRHVLTMDTVRRPFKTD